MYRRRLRPAWTPDQLADLYPTPHDHSIYGYGHHLRVEHTIVLGHWLAQTLNAMTIADLSCGNAHIATRLDIPAMYLGDLAAGYSICGPIETTLDRIPDVDLFVCSETVEHLDDPDTTLARIAGKARGLLLSTPIGETDTGNLEHYWGWDTEAVETMLQTAGWTPAAHVDLILPDTYSYQLWAARRTEHP